MGKLSTIGGLLLGIFSIFGAFFWEGGAFSALFLIPPIIVVFGGTFAAIIIGFGLDKFKKIIKLISLAYFPKKYNVRGLINNLVSFDNV